MKKEILCFFGGLMSYIAMNAQQQRPNVVLILADDMRASAPEFLGKEKSITPSLNQLAKDCNVFTNAHIMGSTNGAVSMPSRAMLMTGKYLYNLEKQGSVLPVSHTTIGEVLRQAGYETFHTGKWHNDKTSFNRCFSKGDDIFFGGMSDHWNVPLFHYDTTGKYEDSRRLIADPSFSNKTTVQRGEYAYSGRHSVDIFTETAANYIDKQDGIKPFFLSLCYMSPHDPRSMPDEYQSLFDSSKIELPKNFAYRHAFDNGSLGIRDEVLAALPRKESEVKRHISEYYAMMAHLDRCIADVIASLKRKGIYDNTIIIFAGDNGLALGQHGLMGKQNVYEHSVGVPLMIKPASKDPKAIVNNKMCYLIDIFPTICDLTGLKKPISVDGISLLPVLTENKSVRNYLYFCYDNNQRAISDSEWKLIKYKVKGIETNQLFHLKVDPLEMINLYTEKKYQDVVSQLEKQMLISKTETNDSSPFWRQLIKK